MTLMPVSRISVAGFCSAKPGALRWMGQCGSSSTAPLPSMGRPSGSNIRPSVPSPTGEVRPWPVASTGMPLPRPSLAESMMQRTVVSLTCCVTSMVRSVPSAVTVSASCRAGSLPAVNCTSTTGPATRIIVPCIIWIASCQILFVQRTLSVIAINCPETSPFGGGGTPSGVTERVFLYYVRSCTAAAPPMISVISCVMEP